VTQQSRQRPPSGTRLPPSVVIGNFKVMHRPGSLFEETKARFVRQGFQVEETRHFLLARPSGNQGVILAHRFSPQEIDNNVVDCLMQELADILTSDQAFGSAMIGLVTSIMPYDPVEAWDIFSLNTLQRLREQLDEHAMSANQDTTIGACATVYRRLFSLKSGTSLLDVGCACAFWPVLVAERASLTPGRIVGVDNRRDAVNLSTNLATRTNLPELTFFQLDLLSPQFAEQLGTFDTVTAIHLLEHLPEAQLPLAFEHLLQVTRHRLLVAVPYESQATQAYGHLQVFSQEKLERWGQWCVKVMGSAAHYWCEEIAGGLLIVDVGRSV